MFQKTCELKIIIRFNQRLEFQLSFTMKYARRIHQTMLRRRRRRMVLIENSKNSFETLVYEIDKVIMNAKHLIDFRNLLNVTQPMDGAVSFRTKPIKLNMCSVFQRVIWKLHYQKLMLSSHRIVWHRIRVNFVMRRIQVPSRRQQRWP